MTALQKVFPVPPATDESGADAIIGDRRSRAPLETTATALNDRYGDAAAGDILSAAIRDRFRGRIALVSSFGAESAALLHLVAAIDPATPVLFLDTGKHFAQTLTYRRQLAKRLGLTNVQDLRPAADDQATDDPSGDLWRRNPDACCDLRKTRPLKSALDGFDAWITGRKQFHGGARVGLPAFEAAPPHIKINPIARWTPADIDAYVAAHDLPPHPLVAEGYPSIGCWPCTHPASTDDLRGGRWRGLAKTECGIHELGRRSIP